MKLVMIQYVQRRQNWTYSKLNYLQLKVQYFLSEGSQGISNISNVKYINIFFTIDSIG